MQKLQHRELFGHGACSSEYFSLRSYESTVLVNEGSRIESGRELHVDGPDQQSCVDCRTSSFFLAPPIEWFERTIYMSTYLNMRVSSSENNIIFWLPFRFLSVFLIMVFSD